MSYLTSKEVQEWLQQDKYKITNLDNSLVERAREVLFISLNERYDTTSWSDESTTPSVVLNLMKMLTASYYLRKVISEDDGEHSYADWLEQTVMHSLMGLSDGTVVLLDQDPSINISFSTPSTHSAIITAHAPNDNDTRFFTVDGEF